MESLEIDRLIKKIKNTKDKESTGVVRAKRKLSILIRDNFSCVECGSTRRLTIDHIINDNYNEYFIQNCQTLCHSCHKLKNSIDRFNERKKLNGVRKDSWFNKIFSWCF